MRKDKQVEREILRIFNSVYNKVFNRANTKRLSQGDTTGILASISNFETSQQYYQFAQKFANELAKKGLNKQRGVWRNFYNVARKKRIVAIPATYTEYENQMMAATVRHNFTMIKSIPQEMRKILEHKYTSTLIEEVAKGNLPRGTFRKQLAAHGVKKAKLIARTETAKLQSAMTQERATNLGSIAYEWVASMDQRTRQSHKEMDGVIVFWRSDNEKPLRDNMRGNAGEFPNCRCYPNPILDESDLTKSNYKVYDYRYDKIISMPRKELLEAINRKGL